MIDPLDVHIGARIRGRREYLHQSQSALAKAIGLTYQQVQKYERGVNRVAASTLFAIAQSQGVPIEFYMRYYWDSAPQPKDPALAWLQSDAALTLADKVMKLDGRERLALLAMAEVLGR